MPEPLTSLPRMVSLCELPVGSTIGVVPERVPHGWSSDQTTVKMEAKIATPLAT